MGDWAIVIPPTADQTNLVTNPSFEINTTGWTAAGSTLARVATYQRRGAYSLSVTPTATTTDGVYFGTVALTNGVTYTFSVDVLGANGVPYQIYFASTVPATLGTPTTFTGTGAWQRVTVTWAENAGASRRLYVVKNNSASTAAFYVDGAQCIAASYDQLYFDGDSRGFRDGDFYWTGTPHASTSVMAAGTRAGGQAVDLTTYGFYVRQLIGLGLAGLSNIVIPSPLIGGGQYQRTIPTPHQFALSGYIKSTTATAQAFSRNRRSLINAFKPDAANTQQPVLLRYQATAAGTATGLLLNIPAIYEGGLEGGESRARIENVALKFTSYLPYVAYEDGTEGTSLSIGASTVSTPQGMIYKSKLGSWSSIGTGFVSGGVYGVIRAPSGGVVAFGSFPSINGVTVNNIAAVNGTSVTAFGTGTNNTVTSACYDQNGTLYIIGNFTQANGVTVTQIAKWNGSTFTTVGTSPWAVSSTMVTVASDSIGNIYVDAFTAGTTHKVYKYNGSSWSDLVNTYSGTFTALSSTSYGASLIVDAQNNLYNSPMGATAYVYKYNGSSWSTLTSSGFVGGDFLALGLDNSLYALGTSVQVWNGSVWTTIGTMNVGSMFGYGIVDDKINYIGPTTINSINIAGGVAIYNGSTWISSDAYILPGSIGDQAKIIKDASGNLYLSSNGGIAPTAYDFGSSSVTNTGTQSAYPVIKLTGPMSLFGIINKTTGSSVYFTNLTIGSGEYAYLDLSPGSIRFTSSFRGNLLRFIAGGSDLSKFNLIAGSNTITVISSGTTGASAAWLYWPKTHWSIDGGAN